MRKSILRWNEITVSAVEFLIKLLDGMGLVSGRLIFPEINSRKTGDVELSTLNISLKNNLLLGVSVKIALTC